MEDKKFIPVFKPLIENEEIESAIESLELGWLGMGSYVNKFENEVRKICDIENSKKRDLAAVSTGHAAIHLSLLMIGVKAGDEVITPSFNNSADFQAIKACGADPVFVDVNKDTLCIDCDKVVELINTKTKCIIAMDYDIHLCDHNRLKEISKKYNIPILHDAAHSFGAYYEGIPIGNQHQYTIFSFDPVKTITCIDGGIIVTSNPAEIKRIHAKRLIGMTQSANLMYTNSRAWTYDMNEIGFRYHMANTHAAIGLAQLNKLDNIRTNRQRICKKYYDSLKHNNWLIAPSGEFDNINPFLYYIRVINDQRDKLREYLKNLGIDTGIHWQPGHKFSFLKNEKRGDLSITEEIAKQILSLPLHSNMSEEELDYIISAINNFI
ncbi:DegT/DnrJ/EryC1/StrS family aminotransferase [Prochlorococcus marinus]|uniref:DegT/DnrJ/EryC1/StrS family aminotransferase n=1 Tax=Prochlorococcus marinus TaxID=1219 RepID=UPI001ADA8FDB|nr:DegT/DnrJ/EryC1/StrS aminotransferase family protein [Prochlorococcus marinus]MBO8217707.1 DegT/DnrJ/EryC1/StrS aminotransferase family protein [Prochlorococcus marinus XMU1405]MBW3040870.1 DegT/DnrJ/EryC1/StrS family aminotransferase [Prochlorococcus marinus str. MU1405]MBW3048330.1 DegT/DnrJ/EryC1/StrS family aminotransferase [Prochlorococcus marinus str. MU1406]